MMIVENYLTSQNQILFIQSLLFAKINNFIQLFHSISSQFFQIILLIIKVKMFFY